MKKKYKLKGWVVISVYLVSLTTILISLLMVGKTLKKMIYEQDNLSYVYRDLIEDAIPVMSNEKNKIIKPYEEQSTIILKNYYDKNDDNVTQENSIIEYQNTYLPNTGILYGNDNQFDILAVLDGTIESIIEDEIMGKIITIRHSNNFITSYQSLSSVEVIVGQIVNKGDIIGKSGINKIETSKENMLLFEVNLNGETINPETIYDKEITEIN